MPRASGAEDSAGWGELVTELHPLTPTQRFYALGKPSILFEIDELAPTLNFLKGKSNYIKCFRGSIRAITQEDFERIISA